MCKSLKECLELFEIRPFIKKISLYFQLKCIEKDIDEQIEKEKFDKNPHQSWEARLKVALITDVFKQEVRDIIIDWKNKIDDKLKNNSDITWKDELLTLKKIVEQIRAGINPLIPFCISILTISLIALLLFLFSK